MSDGRDAADDDLMAIGTLATATGVAVSALRYYDELGLIAPAARVGGKRHFDSPTVGRVNFIRRVQQVGFSLDEIRLLLDDTSGSWADAVTLKLGDLRAQRAELDAMIAVLEEVRLCGCEVVAECPRSITVC